MKSNHRRSFKQKESFRYKGGSTFTAKGPGFSVRAKYIAHGFTNGHRGHSQAISGAKKFLRTRVRRRLKIEDRKEKLDGRG